LKKESPLKLKLESGIIQDWDKIKQELPRDFGINAFYQKDNPILITIPCKDIYVGGLESNGTKKVASVWKNGTPIRLSDGKNNAEVKSVYFDLNLF
jgi:hypothetical protein